MSPHRSFLLLERLLGSVYQQRRSSQKWESHVFTLVRNKTDILNSYHIKYHHLNFRFDSEAARDMQKGADVVKRIVHESGNADVHLIECDLADLESVKKCVTQFSAQIDLLILNAGLTAVTRRTTKQGFEMMVGSNHLGHAYLTHLLLPKLNAGARIVVVGSEAHRWGKLDFDDMHSEKRFSAFPIYARSKLCNLHFARSLAKRLRADDNRGIVVNCVHPGYSTLKSSYFAHNIVYSLHQIDLRHV